ncbi:hypothetical protein YB2330_004380 [Saitoella coloradoensis]
MAKEPQTIYLIRHAQALHNVNDRYHIPDPPLTSLGLQQARDFNTEYSDIPPSVDLIISSPLIRTIQTSLLAFESVLDTKPLREGSDIDFEGDVVPPKKKGEVKFELMAELQEVSEMPCDTPSPASETSSHFPALSTQLSSLPANYHSKSGPWSSDESAVRSRAAHVLRTLKARSERNIAIVTHGGFLAMLVKGFAGYGNAEARRCVWRDEDGEGLELRWVDGPEEKEEKKKEGMDESVKRNVLEVKN